jgi:hypothetical protein
MFFKKKMTIFLIIISINFILICCSYSIEVGERLELRHRMLVEDRIIVSKYNTEITKYEQSSNSFFIKSDHFYPTQYHNIYEGWMTATLFPSNEQISSLLENCETLGWKKDQLELLDPSSDQKILKEVCITTKELFRTMPFEFGADIYYYGHFPIYGIGKMEITGPPREIYYLKNLIFN